MAEIFTTTPEPGRLPDVNRFNHVWLLVGRVAHLLRDGVGLYQLLEKRG